MDDRLFQGGPLSAVFDSQIEKMKTYVDDLPPERMHAATDNEMIAHVVSEFRFEPLTVCTDCAEAEHAETSVDISQDFNRVVSDRTRPRLVKGNRITLYFPFTGYPGLLWWEPTTSNSNAPRGHVKGSGEAGGTIIISLALTADEDESQFNRWIDDQKCSLKQYGDWSRRDVEAFNERLEPQVRCAVAARRQQLEKQGSLLRKLSVPLRRRGDAPSPTPVPMPKRVVKPLPSARKVEQEYGISDEDYEFILKILRHESRSFEATPDTFVKLNEEDLRNVVLAHLNGHFLGDASGERFRRKGKTDICIEYENRAAFVAECKLWSGPKVVGDAIDQLLSYLTWRDTKAALLVWNKSVKNFAKLQQSMPEILQGHPRFVQRREGGHAGEWRAVFRAADDEGREITLQVFLVDLAHDRNAEGGP